MSATQHRPAAEINRPGQAPVALGPVLVHNMEQALGLTKENGK